jgi:hypothetical protein
MQNEKNLIIQEKIYNNLFKILKYLDIELYSNEEENFSLIANNLIIFYFTNYKYKLQKNNQISSILSDFINETLRMSNSKFLITENLSKTEFVNFILYFFIEYEVVNDYLDHLSILNKKYINVNIDNIFKLELERTNDDEIKINQSNFLQSYNKFNMTCKNIKKQLDSFINLSYKLNELKKGQQTPIKYFLNLFCNLIF